MLITSQVPSSKRRISTRTIISSSIPSPIKVSLVTLSVILLTTHGSMDVTVPMVPIMKGVASKGGKAAHEKGTAHEFSSQQAAEAGSKGGKAAHAKGTAHEFSSQEAAAAGRKGGLSSHGGRT